MKKIFNFKQSLSSKCILLAIASIGMSSAVQAETIRFSDGKTGHELSNTTIDGLSISGAGTGVNVSEVTVNGRISVTDSNVLNINDSKIICSVASCDAFWVQGKDYSQTGIAIVKGDGLSIDSARHGMLISGGSSNIDINNLTINAGGNGLDINSSISQDGMPATANFSNFNITAGGYGVYAMFGPEVHLTDGNLTATGDNGAGLYLGGANNKHATQVPTTAYLKNVTVHTTGKNANGLTSMQMGGSNGKPNRGAVSYWDKSNIITEGDGSHGAYLYYASNSATFTNGSVIKTKGNNAYGVYSLGNADAILNNSHVITEGEGSFGVFSFHLGNTYLQNGSTVETTGKNAHGAMVQYAGKIKLDNSTINTHGIDADGIRVVVGLAENSGSKLGSEVELKNSSVVSDQGYGIGVRGGRSTISVLDGSMLKGSAGLMDVQDYTGTSTPSWNQGVTTVDLLVDRSSVFGKATTADSAVSNITLQNSSLWTLDNDSNVTSLVNHDSTINFAPKGTLTGVPSGFSTLHINGDYEGLNGKIIFNAALDDDNSQSDKLIVDGNVSGNTKVKVVNRGGLGAPTEEGIRIIEVGGLSPSGAFALDSDYVAINGKPAIVAGAYGYSLYQGGVTDPIDGNWYLRSEFITNAGGNTNGDTKTPIYQPGAPLYESYANVLHELNTLPTLRERVGERQLVSANGDIDEQSLFGVWSRVQGSFNHSKPSRSTSSAEQDINIWRMQTGVDVLAYKGEQGSLVVGGSLHYGYANSDVDSLFGHGKIDANSYGLAGSLTWYGNNGFYVDTQAQLSWFDSDIKSGTLGVQEVNGNDGNGYTLGLELGRSFELTDNWSLTPQAQVIYSYVDYDDFEDAFQTSVRLKNNNRTVGRLGLSADYSQRMENGDKFDVYGTANMYQYFSDNAKVNVGGVDFEQRNERTWVGAGIGATYGWGKGKYSLYGNVGTKTSVQNFGDSYGVTGNIGFRISF